MEETEAMFELLQDEKDIAAEECRRAQVNMRAAQMDQRELVLELETLRADVEVERKQAEAERAMANFAKAELSRVQHDLEGASGNVRLLQSQLDQTNELQQVSKCTSGHVASQSAKLSMSRSDAVAEQIVFGGIVESTSIFIFCSMFFIPSSHCCLLSVVMLQ